MDILKNHYASTYGDALAQLKMMDLEEGERALEVAARWACRNLRNIQEETLCGAVGEIRQLWVRENSSEARPLNPLPQTTGVDAVTPISDVMQGGLEQGGQSVEAPRRHDQQGQDRVAGAAESL